MTKIDKELEDYEKEDETNVLHKEGSEDLNKKLSMYGLKFRTGTSVATVIKKLKEHKTRLEIEFDLGKLEGRFAGLRTLQEIEGKAKKSENI